MERLDAALGYAADALGSAGGAALALLVPLAVLVAAASASSLFAERGLVALMGPRLYLVAFGWLGTAVHELGHAAMCLLFRHRIEEMRLLDPSLSRSALGYVVHSWDRRSLWQRAGNLFVGVAPVLLGAGVIAAGCWLLLPAAPTDAVAVAPEIGRAHV